MSTIIKEKEYFPEDPNDLVNQIKNYRDKESEDYFYLADDFELNYCMCYDIGENESNFLYEYKCLIYEKKNIIKAKDAEEAIEILKTGKFNYVLINEENEIVILYQARKDFYFEIKEGKLTLNNDMDIIPF